MMHADSIMAYCFITRVYVVLATAAICSANGVDKPSIPTDFHAVVSTTAKGFPPYPNFDEVYQDVTNNRALLVTGKLRSLLMVAPDGAAPGTREETEMTLFQDYEDGSCTYEVNDWPCMEPHLNITQCSTSLGYPVFNKVGPWQLPSSVPNEYAGREVIEINGQSITADKWTEQINTTNSSSPDILTYWVDSSNPGMPLRFQHMHPHKNGTFPGDNWTYQVDYLKVKLGTSPDSVFTPPTNWLERCTDQNAGLNVTNLQLSHQTNELIVYTLPNKNGEFFISLHTRPVSQLPVTVHIKFCNLSDSSQGCVPDEVCSTCAKVSPTSLTFTQENWNQPQKVTAVFDHVGMMQYTFGISSNYPVQNPQVGLEFSVFSCDPPGVPCYPPKRESFTHW